MLHATLSGKGHALVLLHGFCETNTCFNKQVLLLNNYAIQTICIDLPGFGKSRNVMRNSIEEMADAVYQTLAELAIQSCVMVGHSMGGYVTLAFAKKYPQLLKGFGLLHSTAFPDSEDRKAKREQSKSFIQTHGGELFVSNFVPPLFAPGFNDTEAINLAVEQAKDTTTAGLCNALDAMKNRPDSTPFIAQTDLPVLYIAGEYDTVIPKSDLLRQAATLKNGTYHVLKNAGHMGMIEEYETCALILANFVKGCFSQQYVV
jgi:pimeloyl-ACP methyl ester carboxylesterase